MEIDNTDKHYHNYDGVSESGGAEPEPGDDDVDLDDENKALIFKGITMVDEEMQFFRNSISSRLVATAPLHFGEKNFEDMTHEEIIRNLVSPLAFLLDDSFHTVQFDSLLLL